MRYRAYVGVVGVGLPARYLRGGNVRGAWTMKIRVEGAAGSRRGSSWYVAPLCVTFPGGAVRAGGARWRWRGVHLPSRGVQKFRRPPSRPPLQWNRCRFCCVAFAPSPPSGVFFLWVRAGLIAQVPEYAPLRAPLGLRVSRCVSRCVSRSVSRLHCPPPLGP